MPATKDIGTSTTIAVDGIAPAFERSPIASDAPQMLANRYELLGLVGVGGMGAVYRARDAVLDVVVALKMLRPELSVDPAMLARFRAEVRLARRVTHPNVARTFDIGEHEGASFLTMELVDGSSLASILSKRGALPLAEAVAIGRAVCAGMSAAHAASVVHRDLKPDNVLVAKDGRVVITDFGIAGQHVGANGGARSGVIGTPAYMAPEQLDANAPIDLRADVYALGAILFEMVAGERAWPGESVMAILATRLATSVPDLRRVRPDLPEAFISLVARAMATRPADRFTSADEVAAKLQEALESSSLGEGSPRLHRTPLLAPTDKTLAVLSLRNLGPPEDAYLAEGLTEDLTDTLSMTAGLRVRPRTVVARLRSTEVPLEEIGRELGVQVIVDGSLQRVGQAVRFSARLITAADGFQIWARRFQAPLNDLLVLSDDAARAIAAALTTELRGVERRAPTDAEAVELYLRAKHELRRLWHSSPGLVVELFDKALSLAPHDARILAGCAIARTRLLFFAERESEAEVARAREVAERAVELAPDLGDTWAALASFRLNVGDPVGAARALREGTLRAANSALLQDAAGRLLLEVGAEADAIARLGVAFELDPTNIMTRSELARGHALLANWATCDALLDSAEPSVPRDTMRSRLALWRRVPVVIEDAPADSYTRHYQDVLATGALSDAQRAFLEQRSKGPKGRLRLLFLQRNTEIYAFVGDVSSALDAAAAAVDAGLIDLLWMERCPVLSVLRDEARWAALHARVATRAAQIVAAFRGDA